MRIAITNKDGEVFQHFGKTESFMIYDVDDTGKIIHKVVLMCHGISHGALAGLLRQSQVNVVICGGLGMPMYNKLVEGGMKVYGGVEGKCDEVVQDFIDGNLDYDPNAAMNHGGCHHEMMS